jgi:hypothetical protein
MGWIKRNIIFVAVSIVALLALGGGGFYIWQAWSANAEKTEKLNGVYDSLNSMSQKSPAPGNEKVNNTETAKAQQKDVQTWIDSSVDFFQPVTSVPAGTNVTGEAFASALRRTVDQLQRDADAAGVSLPPKYDFSFSAQRPLVKFAPGSLDLLAAQLGEVKALSAALFSARVNALDGIQRVRVSEDDVAGPAGDYTDLRPTTNDLAVITPYVVTFRTFTPELSRVLAAFASCSNTFLVKAVNLQPAGLAAPSPEAGMPGGYPGMPGRIPGEYPAPGGMPPMTQPGAQPVTGKGGLQTVLKEQLLRVTLEVDYVKLLPKPPKS